MAKEYVIEYQIGSDDYTSRIFKTKAQASKEAKRLRRKKNHYDVCVMD